MAIVTSIQHEGQKSTDALSGKLTFEQDKDRIIGKDDDNLIRLLISTNPFEMKIAKEGFDATIATGDQLIFNSSQNVFKIVGEVSITNNALSVAAPGGTSYAGDQSTNSIPHGLGFVPAVLAFMDNGSNYTLMPYSDVAVMGAGARWITYKIYATATDIIFDAEVLVTGAGNASISAGTVSVKCFLLQESAA